MNMQRNIKKRLLFVSTRQFWPPTSGKEVTLYHNCKGLHEKHGYEIYLFCFADKNTDKERETPEFIHEIRYGDIPNIKEVAFRVLVKSIILKLWPIQNALFYSPSISKLLCDYYNEVQPDAFILDMVRLVPYMKDLPDMKIPHILIEDDLLAKRYQRQLDSNAEGSISGYLSDSLSGSLNKVLNTKVLSKIILRGEIQRLEKYESTLPQLFDYITFISPIETKEYNKKHHTTKAITLTMGADVEYCAAGIAGEHIPNSISVVGNFSYGSNAASMEWTSKYVLPQLPKEVRYYVIGKFPDELKSRLNNNQIEPLGYVDDFRTIIKATDIYVAPILYGTGIKTKIVEAMAMGIPVVTNNIGAEGLDVINGKHLFIENDACKIADIIKELLNNKKLREQVGKEGQEYVRRNHDWNEVYSTFKKMGL